MSSEELKKILFDVKNGSLDIDKAAERLKALPFTDLGFAKIDNHRQIRTGYPEVIFCEGKDIVHLKGIFLKFYKESIPILATRASEKVYNAIKEVAPSAIYHKLAKIITAKDSLPVKNPDKKILIVTGGTADISVAEEAAVSAEFLGNSVERLYDVGVAGIHRLISHTTLLQSANVIIAIAGMEGALASVVGGLVDAPVIAVPTSIGYGANFGGLSALLGMLNSCASGVACVNIDNGFGAGYMASVINNR